MQGKVRGAVTQRKEAEQPTAGQTSAGQVKGAATQRGKHSFGGGHKPSPLKGANGSGRGKKY